MGDVRVTVKDGVITGVTELASEVTRDPETFRTIDGLYTYVIFLWAPDLTPPRSDIGSAIN